MDEPTGTRLLRSIALAILGLGGPAFAAQETRLTLAEALRLAEQRSPELLGSRERVDAQAARGESVRRLAFPRAVASFTWSHSDNPAQVFANKLNAGGFTQQDFAIDRLNAPPGLSHLTSLLTVEAPIDLSRRIRAQADAQAAGARALSESTREAVLELRLRVIESYYRAQLALRATEVTERALGAARSRENELAARVGAGAALQADGLRARSRRREREADLAERRGDVEVALAALSRAVAAAADERVLPSESAPGPLPLEGDEAAWRERGLRQRATLNAARERSAGAHLVSRAESRSAWPELGAFAQLQDDRNSLASGQSASFGLAVRWSLLDTGRGKRVAAAAAEERAADHDARAAAAQIQLEVASAYHRARAARERWAAASGGAEEGHEALRVVRERRLAGVATLTDELETETAALLAELREIQAATEAALADAALRRAAGEL